MLKFNVTLVLIASLIAVVSCSNKEKQSSITNKQELKDTIVKDSSLSMPKDSITSDSSSIKDANEKDSTPLIKPKFDLNEKIKEVEKIFALIDEYHEGIDPEDENTNTSSPIINEYDFIKDNGLMVHSIDKGMSDCSDDPHQLRFYLNGAVGYETMEDNYYFFGYFEPLPNGIRPNMTRDEIIKTLGEPRGEKNGMMVYYSDHSSSEYELQGTIYFYLEDDTCFCVAVYHPRVC